MRKAVRGREVYAETFGKEQGIDHRKTRDFFLLPEDMEEEAFLKSQEFVEETVKWHGVRLVKNTLAAELPARKNLQAEA